MTQAKIVGLLGKLNRESGTTVLYISHDLTSVLKLCGRIVVLDSGSVAESMDVQDIEQKANHPVTRALLASLPAPVEVLRAYGWQPG